MFQTLAIFLGLSDRDGRWPRVRREHLLREPTCAACGGAGDLDVHHVRPYMYYPESELDPANLMTLCRAHHYWWGHFGGDWTAWNPDVREDCRTFRAKVLRRIKGRLAA